MVFWYMVSLQRSQLQKNCDLEGGNRGGEGSQNKKKNKKPSGTLTKSCYKSFLCTIKYIYLLYNIFMTVNKDHLNL